MICRSLFSISIVILSCSVVTGQNMVPNSGFEQIKACPISMNQIKFCDGWFPFGTADPTPDFFHSCADGGLMSVPRNIFGVQKAHSGNGYAGLITYLTSKSGRGVRVPANHREFIMVQLTKPLVKGHEYYAEMWVNLADNCEYSTNSLGMYFTENLPGFNWMAMDLGYYKAQVNSSIDTLLKNNQDWMKISGTFIAKGNELALTIGNFNADKNILVEKTGRKYTCLLYTSPSPRDQRGSRMPSSA